MAAGFWGRIAETELNANKETRSALYSGADTRDTEAVKRIATAYHCGERIRANDSVADDHMSLCQDCFDDHYRRCENCGRIVHDNDVCWHHATRTARVVMTG